MKSEFGMVKLTMFSMAFLIGVGSLPVGWCAHLWNGTVLMNALSENWCLERVRAWTYSF